MIWFFVPFVVVGLVLLAGWAIGAMGDWFERHTPKDPE